MFFYASIKHTFLTESVVDTKVFLDVI